MALVPDVELTARPVLLFPRAFVGHGPGGDTSSGWLSALGNQGTQAEWVASVRDHLAWSWVAFHATFHRHMHRHEVCGTQLRCLCARVCLIGARGARLGR